MLEEPCFKVSPQAIAKGIEDLLDENERLNNIINELEEEISRHIALCTDVTLNDILDKLKELKENKL